LQERCLKVEERKEPGLEEDPGKPERVRRELE